MLPGLGISSILVKGNANFLSFHATPIHIFKGGLKPSIVTVAALKHQVRILVEK